MHTRIPAFLDELRAAPTRELFLAHSQPLRAGSFREACLQTSEMLTTAELPQGSVIVLSAPPGPQFLVACCAAWLRRCVVLWADDRAPAASLRKLAVRFEATAIWQVASTGGLADGLPGPPHFTGFSAKLWPEACAIKLTSGSSGVPNGILVTGAQLESDGRALAQVMQFGQADRILASVPMSHSYGFSVLALPALYSGSKIILPEDRCPLLAAAEHGGTVLPSVPSWYRAQVERAEELKVPASIRLLISAGEVLSARVAKEFTRRTGSRIHVLYGASECGAIAFDLDGTAAERGGVGHLLPGVQAQLKDSAAGRGRLAVRSAAVGLRCVPDEVPDRLSQGEFVSEDIAELRDREVFLHGREFGWIKVKGKRVDLREIAEILEEHEHVSEVFVYSRKDQDGDTVLCAAVATRNHPLAYRDLVAWSRGRLEGWKFPRSMIFVPELPRTSRGKVDHAAIHELLNSSN